MGGANIFFYVLLAFQKKRTFKLASFPGSPFFIRLFEAVKNEKISKTEAVKNKVM